VSQRITLAALARKVNESETDFYRNDVHFFLETMFRAITAGLQRGEDVRLKGLGTFTTEETPAGRRRAAFHPEARPKKRRRA